jgi:hypothetical protein
MEFFSHLWYNDIMVLLYQPKTAVAAFEYISKAHAQIQIGENKCQNIQ